MGDIGARQVRFEVLPTTPVGERIEPNATPDRDAHDPRSAPARTEPARS